MTRQHYLRLHLGGTGQRLVKVIDFKPQEDPVPVGFVIRVADGSVMVLDRETVQLHDQHSIGLESLVLRTAMGTPAGEESLIPSATGFDVGYCNEGLWSHRHLRSHLLRVTIAAERKALLLRGAAAPPCKLVIPRPAAADRRQQALVRRCPQHPTGVSSATCSG
jgi:hypothetical protein